MIVSQMRNTAPKLAGHCHAGLRPATYTSRIRRNASSPAQMVPSRCQVIVAALGSTPEEDARLRAAIQRQLQRSIKKMEAEQAAALYKRSEAEIDEAASSVSQKIVDAVAASPDAGSVEVLRSLAARIPLLSDSQVLAAVQRQLDNAGKPRRAPPPRKQDLMDVSIGFTPVVVPSPAGETGPSEPVLSVDEADAPVPPAAPAARKVGLLDEDQLKAALEVQLRRSMAAREAAKGSEGADVGAEAQALSQTIVDEVKAEPNHDSALVMRELAQRIPLLNDSQLYAAISRQLANSSLAKEEGGKVEAAAAPESKPSSNGVKAPEPKPELEKSLYAPERELECGSLVFTFDQLSAVDSNKLLEQLLGPQLKAIAATSSASK